MKIILLLDDNTDIVEVVEGVLTYEHLEVYSTTTCVGFLTVAEQFGPGLILLDYKLADGNGGEICKMVKAHLVLYLIPVIIYSAYTHPNVNLFNFGCDEVIAKPFDLEVLLQTIQQLTAQV